jgi:hypothetical protein
VLFTGFSFLVAFFPDSQRAICAVCCCCNYIYLFRKEGPYHALLVFFSNEESTIFQSSISGHLVQKRIFRDAGIQFIQELFLHVADVHIYLVAHEKSLIQITSTSIRTVKKHDLYSLDFLG